MAPKRRMRVRILKYRRLPGLIHSGRILVEAEGVEEAAEEEAEGVEEEEATEEAAEGVEEAEGAAGVAAGEAAIKVQGPAPVRPSHKFITAGRLRARLRHRFLPKLRLHQGTRNRLSLCRPAT